uniref:Secreted protein n=1 Tax=Anguilla anguilla TaxID=7936 RepID=A0A0E9XX93_ANGAN
MTFMLIATCSRLPCAVYCCVCMQHDTVFCLLFCVWQSPLPWLMLCTALLTAVQPFNMVYVTGNGSKNRKCQLF